MLKLFNKKEISSEDIQNLSPAKKLLLKLGIISTDVPDYAQSSVASVIGSIQAAMPEVDVVLIQMLSTVVSGVALVLAPLYAWFAKRVGRRAMLWTAFFAYLVGSFGPVFFHDINLMLFFRCVLGVSAAICMPITTDYIVHLYEGKEQRSMLGYSQCIASVGSTVFMTVGGFLADIKWYYSFLSAFFAVPFFIIALFVLPEVKADYEDKKVSAVFTENSLLKKIKNFISVALELPWQSWVMIGFTMLWSICLNGYIVSLSLVIVGEGIATAAISGIALTCNSSVRMVFSGLYERVFRIFKRNVLAFAGAVFCVGLALCATGQTIPAFFIGSAFIGIGNGLTRPGMFSCISMTTPMSLKTKAVSVGYSIQSLGTFISPFIFQFIHKMTGTVQGRSTLWVSLAFTAFFTVSMIAYCLKVFNKNGEVKHAVS